MTVENNEEATKAEEKIKAELDALMAPVTNGDVIAACEDDVTMVRKYLSDWSEVGEFSVPRKGEYGFVSGVFVPPALAKGYRGGDKVVVHFYNSGKGPVADKIAKLSEYIFWHEDIVCGTKGELKRRREDQIRWMGQRSPLRAWNDKKEAVAKVGFTLVQIGRDVKSTSYGGRGEDTYFVREAVDEAGANKILDALGSRHERKDPPGPFEHGYDRIRLIDGGFVNEWAGPWTD